MKSLKNYNFNLDSRFLCVAGLNVLEDESLALETAEHLKSVCEKLDLPYVFKASFDKANRSSISSYRGVGLDEGLKILSRVKEDLNLPIITDIHEPHQAEPVSQVADILQIPAFLCRQTDLISEAVKSCMSQGLWLHIKKAQFLAPWDIQSVLNKASQIAGKPSEDFIWIGERGTSFGYNNLVVDFLGISEMLKFCPHILMDATHAVQLPGQLKEGSSIASGGRAYGVKNLAASALMFGAKGVFLEFHPDPSRARCDGPSCLPLSEAESVFRFLKEAYEVKKKYG